MRGTRVRSRGTGRRYTRSGQLAITQGALQALPLSPGRVGFLSTAMFMLHLPTPYPPRAMALLLDFLVEKVAASGSLEGAD